MPLLSVAIITLNEEVNLPRTLASLKFRESSDFQVEVIVVDSGSADRTVEIAKSYGAQVVVQEWHGFAAQKNLAISLCKGDWILSLDADEELTRELQEQIRMLLRSNPPTDAYRIKRRNLFLGRWMRYGGFYPDAKLRLFRRNVADFSRKLEFEDRPVHETIYFDGASSTLDFDLIHHAYPSLESYIEHMDRYSTLGSQLLIRKGRTSRSYLGFFFNVFLIPQMTFIWNYFFRLGFLDGREGLLLHLYHATYTSWKYSKAWQATRKQAD